MTRHHVTANLTPGESSIVVDGVDLSMAVARSGVRVHIDSLGRPVVTLQMLPGVTVDLDADAEVRVEQDRSGRLRALERLALRGITGDDAVTALDSFLVRTADYLHRQLGTGLTAEERLTWLESIYGPDSVRVAQVLLTPRDSDSAVDELRARLTGSDRG